MKHILKCKECNKYTMKELCSCGAVPLGTKPQRYTVTNIGKYRREARKQDLEKKGLI